MIIFNFIVDAERLQRALDILTLATLTFQMTGKDIRSFPAGLLFKPWECESDRRYSPDN